MPYDAEATFTRLKRLLAAFVTVVLLAAGLALVAAFRFSTAESVTVSGFLEPAGLVVVRAPLAGPRPGGSGVFG